MTDWRTLRIRHDTRLFPKSSASEAILSKINAVSVADESSSDLDGDIIDFVGSSSSGADGVGWKPMNNVLGGRKGRRMAGAAGIKVNGGDEMVQYVGQIAESVSSLVGVLSKIQQVVGPTGGSAMESSIRMAVTAEVKVDLAHTNTSLEELKTLFIAPFRRSHQP